MSEIVDAERACLGALVQVPELIRSVPRLQARHFLDPRHRLIFDAVREAAGSDTAVPDEMVVLHRLQVSGHLKVGSLDGPYLAGLIGSVPTLMNVTWYGQLVLDAARRRALLAHAEQVRAAAERASDDDVLTESMARLLVDAEGLAVAQSVTAGGKLVGYHQLADFVYDEDATDSPWVIPGILRAMERVVVVAGEGAGKTTLARVVATATAGGRHFLNPESRIPSMRTLMVDLENPPSLIRSKMRPMVERLRGLDSWDDERAWLYTRPGGINLRSADDAAALERVIEQARPQLVCFGPVYKAFVEGATDRAAQAAREVVAVLDRLREKHKFALWVEAHAPLEQGGRRELRPFGSQLWLAWPEFGIGLRRDEQDPRGHTLLVERFRGDRDEREWPSKLFRGDPSYWPYEGEWANGMPQWLMHNRDWSA